MIQMIHLSESAYISQFLRSSSSGGGGARWSKWIIWIILDPLACEVPIAVGRMGKWTKWINWIM